MDFKTATDILTQGPSVTLARIAERFGVQLATIARARIDTNNRRPPPGGWETVIAELAETHAKELEGQVAELRRLSGTLRGAKVRTKT
jgi:transposase-like protein